MNKDDKKKRTSVRSSSRSPSTVVSRSASPDTSAEQSHKPCPIYKNLRANLHSCLLDSAGRVAPKRPLRPNPKLIATKYPNDNIPIEASAINVDPTPTLLPNGTNPFDECNMFDAAVYEEFSAQTIATLTKTSLDPEPFLVPLADANAALTVNLLSRRVRPLKVVTLLVDYMNRYYDLTVHDRDPYSKSRQEMDVQLYGRLTYLLPMLCKQMVELFATEPLVVTTKCDAVVFGDLHGNFNDMWYIYNRFLNNPAYASYRFVFLGDYVDRGPKPVEILTLLFCLKLAYPERYVILRGNHEVAKVNRKYGFQSLCERLFADNFMLRPVNGVLVYKSLNRVFTYLPVATVVVGGASDRAVWCCHGGVPNPKLKCPSDRNGAWTIDQLNALTAEWKPATLSPTKRAPPAHLALNEVLWNDPIPVRARTKAKFNRKPFYRNKKRGGHCSFFTEAGLRAFLRANQLSMVIRGHQYRHCKNTGFELDFDGRLLTVFSSSNYCGTESNTTGCAIITGPQCSVRPTVLRTKQESQDYHDFNFLKIVTNPITKQIVDVFV